MNNSLTIAASRTMAGLILTSRQSARLIIDAAKQRVDRLLRQTKEGKSQDTGEQSDAENQQDDRTTEQTDEDKAQNDRKTTLHR